MNDHIVLITGATGGIGKETARGLARKGATVVVTGRDATRGEDAVRELRASTGNERIHLLLADLSSLDEVQRLAQQYLDRFGRLDGLINNLGGLYAKPWRTADGLEATFAVNALTPFALTHALLGALRSGRPGRVVNVTGGMPTVPVDLDDLQGEKGFRGLDNYSHAKVAMMVLSLEFARRLERSGVAVNVVYPGAAATDMTKNMTSEMMPSIMRVFMPVLMPVMSRFAKPERAARSSIRVASDPELEGVTGRYYGSRGRERSWPKAVLDASVGERLWAIAEELTGVGAKDGVPKAAA